MHLPGDGHSTALPTPASSVAPALSPAAPGRPAHVSVLFLRSDAFAAELLRLVPDKNIDALELNKLGDDYVAQFQTTADQSPQQLSLSRNLLLRRFRRGLLDLGFGFLDKNPRPTELTFTNQNRGTSRGR